MPVSCRLITKAQAFADDYTPQPGDMWPRCPEDAWQALVEEWRAGGAGRNARLVADLSDQYLAGTIDRRPPYWVVLPSGDWFCIDCNASSDRRGWDVTGDPPAVTLSPSIACHGRAHYHGFLKDGVLTDHLG